MTEVKEDHAGNLFIFCDGAKVASVNHVITRGGKGSQAWTGPDYTAIEMTRAEALDLAMALIEAAKP